MPSSWNLSILCAAYNACVDVEVLEEKDPIVAKVPFSSTYKFMSTIHEPVAEIDGKGFDGKYIVHVKSAPDRMLAALCNTHAKARKIGKTASMRRNNWTEQIAALSSAHGPRILALTRTVINKSDVKPGEQLGAEFINECGEKQWLTIVGLWAIQQDPTSSPGVH